MRYPGPVLDSPASSSPPAAAAAVADAMRPLRQVLATRYVVPLREGGSLPGVIEGDDHRLWVAKLRGAGQGAGALLAEIVAGKLARALGLPMPELVLLQLPPRFGVTDGDPEINHLLGASAGDNVGMAFLEQAIGYDPAARRPVDAELAAKIVAFDVLLANVDRTFRNPNLLWSGGALWLIDHGAAMYWQHSWDGNLTNATSPLPRYEEHVLLPLAGDVAAAAAQLVSAVDDGLLAAVLAAVPTAWLGLESPSPEEAAARRGRFVERLRLRREALVGLVTA